MIDRNQKVRLPDEPIAGGGDVTEAQFFAAVECLHCHRHQWRVLRPMLLAPWERELICMGCGRCVYVEVPGWHYE